MEISDNALKEFRRLLCESGIKDGIIRIFVSGGGCCGPAFGIDVFPKGEPNDEIMEKDELKVHVENRAVSRLQQATIDFMESDEDPGFIIKGIASSCCQ
jgi:iron-sulfur cluster assembly accessory protein